MPDTFGPNFTLDVASLRRLEREMGAAFERSANDAMDQTAREYELKLEVATARVGGGKLARAWSSKFYGKGTKGKATAAGVIYLNGRTRTLGAMRYLTTTGRVQSRYEDGWMAIPLPAAGPRGRRRDLTPGEWERRTGIRLRFVYRGGQKPALLVADSGTTGGRTGSFRPITRKRTAADEKRGFARGEQTVPIFVLIAPYAHQQRFSIEETLAGADETMTRRMLDNLGRTGRV